METSPNNSKHRKDAIQSESPITGETGLADSPSNTVPNARAGGRGHGAEPNFNLSLNLASPRNLRVAAESSKLHGGIKKDNGNKGGRKSGARAAVSMETGMSASTLPTPVRSPGERDDLLGQKSKIPAMSRSPTTEALANSRGEQRLKSPNLNHTPALSPKLHTPSKIMASPKPLQEQTTIARSPRTTEKFKDQELRNESASVSDLKPLTTRTTEVTTKATNKMTGSLKLQTNRKEDGEKETQSPKMLDLQVSPRVSNQKGDSNVVSPKLADKSPTTTVKTQKTDLTSTKLNKQTRHDSRIHSSETQNQRTLTNKASRPSSLSPKPPTQKKASGTRNPNASGSKESLDVEDSSVGSGSKTSSESTSICKAAMAKDSLHSPTGSDSKASPNSKTSIGSEDSLDSKGSPPCKTSWGSKDSLDPKTNSKSSTNCKSGMGSGDSLDFKTATEIKASKASTDLEMDVGSKFGMGSKDDLDSKTQTSSDFEIKTSPHFKPDSKLNSSCNSDVLSNSGLGRTCSTFKPSLASSGSMINLVGSVSSSSSKTGLSGTKDNNLKNTSSSTKSSPDPKVGSNSAAPRPVRSGSKSALADLSFSSTLSPRPSSASRSPGSGPVKSLGSGPSGPHRESQKSSGSAPGSGLLAPLATSSPKTRPTVALTTRGRSTPEPAAVGSVTVETNPSMILNSTSLTRGLTFDSITKTSVKTGAADKEEHLKPPETKMTAGGGPPVSRGARQGEDVTDNAGGSPGTLLSKPSPLGGTNAINAGSNIPSSKVKCEESKEEGKEKLKGVQQKECLETFSLSPSSPLHPLPQPFTNTPSSKTVRETATMTDPSETHHLQRSEQRDVGVQVEVVDCSASARSSLHMGATTSSLTGSPSCQSGGLTSPLVPSLGSVPISQPPFQHVCKIDIEMVSQSVLPSVVTDKASSLPACLRTYSFQRSPALMSELQFGQNQDRHVSAESISEEEEKGDNKIAREQNKEKEERKENEKPQEVAWDTHGMTWEVYGASVDLECLGTAIQSHLEAKIQEQEKHIKTLRKSICSNSSLRGYKMKKRKKRRGGILGCCRKAPAVAD